MTKPLGEPDRDEGRRNSPLPFLRRAGRRLVMGFFVLPITVYRLLLSPFLPPSCRHLPSCSDYAQEAITRNGPWKGFWLALSRILRCHPWGTHGYDPVPDLTQTHHPFWAPWRYGRWTGRHLREDSPKKSPAPPEIRPDPPKVSEEPSEKNQP